MFFAPSAKETWRQTMCAANRTGLLRGPATHCSSSFLRTSPRSCGVGWLRADSDHVTLCKVSIDAPLACLTTLVDHSSADLSLATLFALGTSIGISIGVDSN